MNSKRLLLVFSLFGLGIGASTVAIRFFLANRSTETAIASSDTQRIAREERMAALTHQIAVAERKIRDAESDNQLLTEALARVPAPSIPAPSAPLDRQELEARFKNAATLAQTGDPAEALRELMWCWDEGSTQLPGSTGTAYSTLMIAALADLAKRFPPAAEVLRVRGDALHQRVLAGPGGRDSIPEYLAVLRGLGDGKSIAKLFEEIPKGAATDLRRSMLAIYGVEELVGAHRYDLAVEGRNPVQMISAFTLQSKTPAAAVSRNGQPSSAVRNALQNLEILAGSGNLSQARELADKVIAFDPSPETRALLQKSADRAGQPALLSPAN